MTLLPLVNEPSLLLRETGVGSAPPSVCVACCHLSQRVQGLPFQVSDLNPSQMLTPPAETDLRLLSPTVKRPHTDGFEREAINRVLNTLFPTSY